MFLIPFLPFWAERDAPMHGINQEHLRLPLPWLTPSRLTQPLCVSPKTRSSITASRSPGCTSPHPAPLWDLWGPQQRGHGWELPTILHHPLFPPFQRASRPTFRGDRRVWKLPVAPRWRDNRERGKGRRWRERDEVVGESGGWAEGDSEVKVFSSFVLDCK